MVHNPRAAERRILFLREASSSGVLPSMNIQQHEWHLAAIARLQHEPVAAADLVWRIAPVA